MIEGQGHVPMQLIKETWTAVEVLQGKRVLHCFGLLRDRNPHRPPATDTSTAPSAPGDDWGGTAYGPCVYVTPKEHLGLVFPPDKGRPFPRGTAIIAYKIETPTAGRDLAKKGAIRARQKSDAKTRSRRALFRVPRWRTSSNLRGAPSGDKAKKRPSTTEETLRRGGWGRRAKLAAFMLDLCGTPAFLFNEDHAGDVREYAEKHGFFGKPMSSGKRWRCEKGLRQKGGSSFSLKKGGAENLHKSLQCFRLNSGRQKIARPLFFSELFAVGGPGSYSASQSDYFA